MHEKRRRAGTGEGGGDFAADMTGLAHARDDDAAPAVKTNAAGACKIRPETRQLRAQSVDLDGKRLASEVDEVLVGVVGIHSRNDTGKLEQFLRRRHEPTTSGGNHRGG